MIYFILVLGLLIRIISLNQSLWLDETTTALAAKMSLKEIFTKFMPGDFHPPLHYLVMKFWVSIFGPSEISLRVPSIIFTLALIYITYLIVKKIFDEKTALISALLVSTSGLSVYYSQEARMYAMAAFLVGCSVYFYLKKKWIWFFLTLPLIAMTDYVSLLILPVFFFADKKLRKKFFASLIPLAVIFTLWLPTFIKQISGGLGVKGTPWWNILGPLTLKNILLIPIKFTLGRISFNSNILYALVVIFSCGLLAFIISKTLKSSKIILMWLILPISIGVVFSLVLPIFYYFRFLFCLPAFYILIAAGLTKFKKTQNYLLAAVILINVASTSYYLFNDNFHREDWRSAAKAIGSEEIVLPGSSHKEALIYYGKKDQIIAPQDLAGQETIWLSRYVWEISDPGDLTRGKIESLGYTKEGEYNFNGVVFWKYNMNLYANKSV